MNIQNDINEWIEEEITISELMDRFFGINDLSSPEIYDVDGKVEILGRDLINGIDIYKPIKHLFVKESVSEHYTDGKLKASLNHNLIENNKNIRVQDHPDFKKENTPINVVDFEIEDIHNYYANGRLNHNTVSGGKALPHASSVRIRLSNIGKLKNPTTKEVYGMECQAQIIKSRFGPNFKIANFNIFYDSGVQDLSSWVDFMKLQGIITGSGHGYTYKKKDDTEVKFKGSEFPELIKNDPALKEEIYQVICDKYIMKYKDFNSQVIDHIETVVDDPDDMVKNVSKDE